VNPPAFEVAVSGRGRQTRPLSVYQYPIFVQYGPWSWRGRECDGEGGLGTTKGRPEGLRDAGRLGESFERAEEGRHCKASRKKVGPGG
jgi:hypothetical protein